MKRAARRGGGLVGAIRDSIEAVQQTLWSLLGERGETAPAEPVRPQPRSQLPEATRPPAAKRPRRPRSTSEAAGVAASGPPVAVAVARGTTAAARYEAIVEEMLSAHSIRVRRWRRGTTGVAWEIARRGGVQRWIEAPYPKGPVSCAVFLHEIAHHAIGFNAVSPRCLEEHAAWVWALARMRERGIEPGPSVERRMHEALHYALAKALRRGLRRIPAELEPYRTPLRKTGATR